MLLVVFHHVSLFTFGIKGSESAIGQFFISFRMPMFFFISGYVAYKAVHHWTYEFYVHRLITKAKVQLVPTMVFWGLYYLVVSQVGFPGGFWFTESLFEMFLVYFSLAFISRKLGRTETTAIIVSMVAMFVLNRSLHSIDCINPRLFYILAIENTSQYYLFFCLGVLMKKYNGTFIALLESKVIVTLAMILSTVLLIILYKYHTFDSVVLLHTYSLGLMLVFVIFASFHKSSGFWNRDGWLQNTMEYIGRRTLDLYMLHYFLLPDLRWLKGFIMGDGNQIVTQVFVIGSVTLMVTGCALLVSILLRTSPLLAKWLFGVSPKSVVKA